jgi:ABC-type oligopeptide transport system substrate-binding subunit
MKIKKFNATRGLWSVVFVAIALGSGCHAKQKQPAQRSSLEDTATLRRGLGGEPSTLDPGAAVDSFCMEVLVDMYEGLTAESADGTSIKQMAVALAAMWKETLGIETKLIDEEYRAFLDSRKDYSRWDVVRLAWLADYNDAGSFLDTFRSDSANDDSGYDNPKFDALIEAAERTPDLQKRREILESAERTMLADYPVIPIFFYSSKGLFKPYVRGETSDPLNRLYSKHLVVEAH